MIVMLVVLCLSEGAARRDREGFNNDIRPQIFSNETGAVQWLFG
jgi:hypothetical protein